MIKNTQTNRRHFVGLALKGLIKLPVKTTFNKCWCNRLNFYFKQNNIQNVNKVVAFLVFGSHYSVVH